METKVKDIAELVQTIMKILELPITESNEDTPKRIAKMWCNELFKNRNLSNFKELEESMTLFPNKYEDNELVIMKDITFNSMCEHHWLPFSGTVTVGYVPNRTVIGLSKIPRVVKYFSKMPQLQEQFTQDIGNYLCKILQPHALFVEVEAKHQCVSCRGAESDCSTHTNFKMIEKGYEHAYDDFKVRCK